jgi:hypothetical protein
MFSSSSFPLIPVISSVMHALVGSTCDGVYNGTGPSNGTIHARERYYHPCIKSHITFVPRTRQAGQFDVAGICCLAR